jgi:phosphinothricin acetyltransferase
MPPIFRISSERDAEQIQPIYAPIVRDTIISFELECPTVAEMWHFILSSLVTHSWLVCDNGGGILGYVYASQHRGRAAYQWAVDVSDYIKE